MRRFSLIFSIVLLVSFSYSLSYSADHTQARVGMIGLQKQACPAATSLLVGDSNTEGLWWNYVCGNTSGGWFINGGIGGTTVKEYLDVLPQVLSQSTPSVVTVALGTNDANAARVGSPDDLAWETNYTALITALLAAGKKVTLFTIPPVEQNKPLGEGYFLTSQIQRYNAHIRLTAQQRGLALKDLYALWANTQGFAASGSTTDGVHHTRAKQVAYYYQLEDAIRTMRATLGLTCP
ncbi:SGNH/GDSL hydrolase family protein [Nitratidesulfovibrio liaohensis]|uniref:SGNH/GDSL hydrolase family protein n=1 Tax=Nitratidesulfovibrio liaohensis TaxID=2604158 RepID=A0ABY9R782_9BACT|nr:SGNH/GDSL hydrolase family protein [Nitratidesulfovibrio liaohensis]WMW66673.1 SGNH/GDSL hydrolase family protein [Nitratidesulfovibrio liaohensis]